MNILNFSKCIQCNHKEHTTALITFSSLVYLLFLLLPATRIIAQDKLIGLTNRGGKSGGGTAFSIKTNADSFSILRNFKNLGNRPYGSLIQGKDGYYYGMMTRGGTHDNGTVFKMSSSGAIIFTLNFNDSTGADFGGSLIQAYDGNFYGMTGNKIFKMTSSGTMKIFKSLDYNQDGGLLIGSLVQGKDSNFYGMAMYGGLYSNGTVFKVTPAGSLTVLQHLVDSSTGGAPNGDLIQGKDGNFYGLTSAGGKYGYGTIFKMTSGGKLTVLKHLENITAGGRPYGSLVEALDGSFYGMNSSTIFKITNVGSFSVVKSFSSSDGFNPRGNLLLAADGTFYGMTAAGGLYNNGTIFKFTAAYSFSVLRNLSMEDGISPYGSLCNSRDGYFYGMTGGGGDTTGSRGTVFRISPTGSTFNVLLRFTDGGGGSYPSGSLVQSKNGYYYGMAADGGKAGYGSIYRLCTNGSFTTLNSFDFYVKGGRPRASLIQAKDGNYYGMAPDGGANSGGTIFKVTTSGTVSVLKSLENSTTGDMPFGSLVQGADGNFYGTTRSGGAVGYGTIFKTTSDGVLTVLKNLNDTLGGIPKGSLIQAKDGAFYGMTYQGGISHMGVIFKLTASGIFTVIKHLSLSTGGNPSGSLIQGKDSAFYGMTSTGGAYNSGTIFKVTSAGTFTILKHFKAAITGGHPLGALVQGSDGMLYGMTFDGGTYNGGTIFKIKPDGTLFVVLRHFNPATDGSNPTGGLIIQKANPVATSQIITTTQNTSKKVKLVATGGSPLSYAVSTTPLHGTAVIVKDSLTYTPLAGYSGADSLYYIANWGCQKSIPAKIKFTISAAAAMRMQAALTINKSQTGVGKSLRVLATPNPFYSHFTLSIQSTLEEPITIQLYDAIGQKIKTISHVKTGIQIVLGDAYTASIYYCEVQQGNERVAVKLVRTAL